MSRFVLNALREAPSPMTVATIAQQLLERDVFGLNRHEGFPDAGVI